MAVKRTQIIEAIVTRLQGINAAAVTAGTYHRALVTVEQYRSIPLQGEEDQHGDQLATELPAAIVRDTTDEVVNVGLESSYAVSDHAMNVRIEVVAANDATLAAVREHLADIYKAIGTDEKWSNYAQRTEPVRDEIVIDQADRRISGAIIDVRVFYRTQRWQES
jgi:hypothetical protein